MREREKERNERKGEEKERWERGGKERRYLLRKITREREIGLRPNGEELSVLKKIKGKKRKRCVLSIAFRPSATKRQTDDPKQQQRRQSNGNETRDEEGRKKVWEGRDTEVEMRQGAKMKST